MVSLQKTMTVSWKIWCHPSSVHEFIKYGLLSWFRTALLRIETGAGICFQRDDRNAVLILKLNWVSGWSIKDSDSEPVRLWSQTVSQCWGWASAFLVFYNFISRIAKLVCGPGLRSHISISPDYFSAVFGRTAVPNVQSLLSKSLTNATSNCSSGISQPLRLNECLWLIFLNNVPIVPFGSVLTSSSWLPVFHLLCDGKRRRPVGSCCLCLWGFCQAHLTACRLKVNSGKYEHLCVCWH